MATWKDAVISRYKMDDPGDRYLCCSKTCVAIINGGTTCGFYLNKQRCNGVRLIEREKAYELAKSADKPKKAIKTKW